MKEITVVTTCEITDVIKVEDDFELRETQAEEKLMEAILDADDVKILKQQKFIRDLPDQ